MFSDEIYNCVHQLENYIKNNGILKEVYPKNEVITMLKQMIYVMSLSDSQLPDRQRTRTLEELKEMAENRAVEICNNQFK